MASPWIAGDRTPRELKPARRFDARTGWQTVRRWRGFEPELKVMQDELSVGALTSELRQEDGEFFVLEIAYGFVVDGSGNPVDPNSLVVTEWSLVGNDIEKSLWELPIVANILKKLPPTARVLWRKEVEAFLAGDFEDDDLITRFEEAKGFQFDPNLLTEADKDVLGNFIGELAAGNEVFPYPQYVIRRVMVAPNAASARPAYVNVDKIFTAASLQALEFNPLPLFACPEIPYWLKRSPQMEPFTQGSYRITQEWWGVERFSLFTYGEAI